MKKKLTPIFLFLICTININAQIYFSENFEDGIPTSWNQEVESGSLNWRTEDGGYEDPDINQKFPSSAINGEKNAIFQVVFEVGFKTKLVTEAIDLSGAKKPELTFWHAQDEWGFESQDWDRLRLYCKPHIDSSWTLLEEYIDVVDVWTEQALFIPDTLLSNTVYIAFEGETHYGYGTCIDSIQITERGVIPKHITDFDIKQSDVSFTTPHSDNTPVMRIDLDIFGNAGDLILNSLDIEFEGTDIDDIEDSGVKLFYTDRQYFSPHNPIGSAVSFAGPVASFSGLDYEIPYGESYLWVTYDPDSTDSHGNILDAKLLQNSIDISLDTSEIVFNEYLYKQGDSVFYIIDGDTTSAPLNYSLPTLDINPEGSVYMKDEIFFDDFESSTSWDYLLGDFQIDMPRGIGATQKRGSPDPEIAYMGNNVLGTDLTLDGDYLNNYSSDYYAQTKSFDAYYYKDLKLAYQLWLNKESYDKDFIVYLSTDNGATWRTVKKYLGDWSLDSWSFQDLDLDTLEIDRAENIILRINAGPTDITNVASGWNIDNFVLAGDYIANDVSISELISPGTGCGHSSSDSVTVKVKNHGPTVCSDTIPIFYSFYGGDSIVYDTIFNANLAPEDSMIFTFSKRVDLTTSGSYDVILATDLPSDEYRENDTVFASLYIQPTIDLPYAESFEEKQGLWVSNGNENNTWEWGYPNDGAQSGLNAWATKLVGNYKNLDSSWVESVCFNLGDTLPKIIDFYHKADVQEGVDGAILEYTTDNGQTWNSVDAHTYTYDWNWYNSTVTSLDGDEGWSKNYSTWTRERQVLPDILDDETQVKFRIRFKSDAATNGEGIFIDNFKLYKAPYDIGVVSIDSITDACQNVNDNRISFTIKNFGISHLQAGDTIIFGIDATNNGTIIDTLLLESDLFVNDSVTLKSNKEIDLSGAGNYDIDVYTLIEDEPFYYWPTSNDTASLSITIYPNPQTDLQDTIRTARPDTLVLSPIYDVDYDYLWQPGNITDREYNVSVSGDHYLTVTNTNGTGCITEDTVNVMKLIPDITVDSLASPVSSCEFGSEVFIDVNIKNTGTDTLEINDTIYITYEFEGLEVTSDTFFLAERFYPDSVLTFTIDKESVDMSSLESVYDFKIYSDYRWDITKTNDTLSVAVESFGYPTLEILDDAGFQMGDSTTVYVKSKILNGGTFDTYLWSSGATTQRDTIFDTGYHSLTITDEHGCPDDDSVYIKFDYLDIGLTSILVPQTSCVPVDSFNVKIEIANEGTDTVYQGASLDVGYTLNGGSLVSDVYILDVDLLPDESVVYEFSKKEWFANPTDSIEIDIEAFSLASSDINSLNDTVHDIRYFYGFPEFELGQDTLVKALSYTMSVNETTGYSYLWSTGSDSASTIISTTNDYTLTITSSKGCSTVDSKRITIVQPDLRLLGITSPVTGCMPSGPVTVEMIILNSGTDTLDAGDDIEIGYQLNGGIIHKESVTLSSELKPNSHLSYELSDQINFTEPGEYGFAAFVDLEGDLNRDNDDINETIEIYGYPVVELGNDTLIRTTSYKLVANDNPTYTYLWSTGQGDSTITVSGDGTYGVTVTTINGCSTEDEITLQFRFPNIGVIALTEPTDLCGSDEKIVAVDFENFGSDTILAGESIQLGYRVNNGEAIVEQLTLGEKLLPGDKINYTYSNAVDMSEAGDYSFKLFTALEGDLVQTDDTLNITLSMLAMPVPKFMEDAVDDTLKTDLPVTLDAGSGFIKWVWDDGQGLRVHNVSEEGWYSVTVTNANGCVGSGTVYVLEDTTSVYVEQFLDEQLSLDIYPNPANEVLYVDLDTKIPGRVIMQFFDFQGKAVLTKQVDIITRYKETVDITGLPRGIYILRVAYNDKVKSYRIVKQ